MLGRRTGLPLTPSLVGLRGAGRPALVIDARREPRREANVQCPAFREQTIDVTPAFVLATWAAGLSAGAALVVLWRIVGPGFTWLAGGVTLLAGIVAVAAGAGRLAVAGTLLALGGTVAARRPRLAAAGLALGAAAYAVAAVSEGEALLAVTGAVALGAISTEMLLGHWYLVDPRLPRWALHRLDEAAATGLALDVAALVVLGVLTWPAGDDVIGWAFVALAAMSALLIVAVWFALREPRYSGVMAATGLSYLAVLTVFGASVTGRILVA